MKEELLEEQRIAARLIAEQIPFAKIARELKISISMLTRWRKDANFMQWVAEIRQEMASAQDKEASVSMDVEGKELLPLALHSLRDLLESQSDPTKLGAVRLVVQICKQTQAGKNKEVTVNEAVFEAATQMLVELFNRREDLKKEALIELEKTRHSEGTLEGEFEEEAGTFNQPV